MDQDSNNHSGNPFQPLIGLANRVANRVNRMAGLSSGHTQSLVERLTRQGEHNQVWVPDIGSLSPHMVERFSSAIVQRFPNITGKYLIEAPKEKTGDQQETNDLVLSPGGLAGPALWQPEPDSQAQPAMIEPPARPNLPGSDTPPPPSMLIRAAEPVQRKPNVRPISRTEEMKPGVNPVSQSGSLFSGKTDPSLGISPRVENAVQRSVEPPRTPDIDRRSTPVDRAEPTQSRAEDALQRVSSETTLPAARVISADQPVIDARVHDAHAHITKDLSVQLDQHPAELPAQRSEPVSTSVELPSLAPPAFLQTRDDLNIVMRTPIEPHTGAEPGEPNADLFQPPSREPARPAVATPFEQSGDGAPPLPKAQSQAVRLDRKISEEQSTPSGVETQSSEPVTGQVSLPLAPMAQPKSQVNPANIPEPHNQAEPDRTLLQRATLQNSKGEEAQTFEPIIKTSPPPSQNIPPARSTEPVMPLDTPLAAAKTTVQKSPAGADNLNQFEPSRQAVESAGEPLFQPEPQHQNLPDYGKPGADSEPEKASEPVTDLEPSETGTHATDAEPTTQHHQAEVERVAHAEPSIQKLPLAGKPTSAHLETPMRTPVQDSQRAAQPEPAELTLPPAAVILTQPDTHIQKLPLAGEPSLQLEAPVQTFPDDIQPAEHLRPAELILPPAEEGITQPGTRIQKLPLAGEPPLHLDAPVQSSPDDIHPVPHLDIPSQITPPAVDGVVQHVQQIQKRPLLGEQVKHPELSSPLTLAPAGKSETHSDASDQSLTPVSDSRKLGPQPGPLAQVEQMISEPNPADTHPEKSEITASLSESPDVLRKALDPGRVEPGMPAQTVRSTDPEISDLKISPDAYIRKESDAAIQRLPLAPVDLVQPTRNESGEVQPGTSHETNPSAEIPDALRLVSPQAETPNIPDVVAKPAAEIPDAPRAINPPPLRSSNPARMEGIQREVEIAHPRQPEKQDLSQPTTGESPQPLVQRKTNAEPAALEPATSELPETHLAPIELTQPQNSEPLENPDKAEVDKTPKPARSMPVQENSVDPLILRRLVKNASREPEQSVDAVSPESQPELPVPQPESRPHDELSRVAEPMDAANKPIRPAPGLDHTLMARAAARVMLPLTTPRVEIRRQANNSQPIQLRVSTEPQQSRSDALFVPIQSPAVLPQARFDRTVSTDDDNHEPDEYSTGLVQLTPSSPYHRAGRGTQLVQKLPLVQRASEPVLADDQSSNNGSTSPEEHFGAAPPPLEQIQRMLANGAFNQPVVQRAEAAQLVEDGETSVNEEDDELDLDQIARDVYPIIKRLLAIERERYKGR